MLWFEDCVSGGAERRVFCCAENERGNAVSRSGIAAEYPAYLHQQKRGRILLSALICAIRFLPCTVAMSVLNLVPWIVLAVVPDTFLKWGILWLILWFALAAYWNICLLGTPLRLLTESSAPPEAECAAGETDPEE